MDIFTQSIEPIREGDKKKPHFYDENIGSPVKINKSNSISGFLVFYEFVTKPIKYNQTLKFSADPPHKMWE